MSDYINIGDFGKDHRSLLAYVETVVEECHTFQVGFDAHMSMNRAPYFEHPYLFTS